MQEQVEATAVIKIIREQLSNAQYQLAIAEAKIEKLEERLKDDKPLEGNVV